MRGDVRLAHALGVSPSKLWGHTPTSTTNYEYDADGRLLRATTTTESEFSDTDRNLLLAWDELEQLTGRHGELLTEALSDTSDPNNRAATHRYVAGVALPNGQRVPMTNFAEKALIEEQNRYYKAYGEEGRQFHHWPVTRLHRKK